MEKSSNNCYLDTNCLIYFVQGDSPFHKSSLILLEKIINMGLVSVISPLCLDEFLYNITGSLKQKTIIFKKILNIPNLIIVNPPSDKKSQLLIPKLMSKYKLGPRDAYHLLTAISNKIKYFATFDHDFDSVFSSKLLKQF